MRIASLCSAALLAGMTLTAQPSPVLAQQDVSAACERQTTRRCLVDIAVALVGRGPPSPLRAAPVTGLAQQGRLDEALALARGVQQATAFNELLRGLAKAGRVADAESLVLTLTAPGERSFAAETLATSLAIAGRQSDADAIAARHAPRMRADDMVRARAVGLVRAGKAREALALAAQQSDGFVQFITLRSIVEEAGGKRDRATAEAALAAIPDEDMRNSAALGMAEDFGDAALAKSLLPWLEGPGKDVAAASFYGEYLSAVNALVRGGDRAEARRVADMFPEKQGLWAQAMHGIAAAFGDAEALGMLLQQVAETRESGPRAAAAHWLARAAVRLHPDMDAMQMAGLGRDQAERNAILSGAANGYAEMGRGDRIIPLLRQAGDIGQRASYLVEAAALLKE